MANQIVTVNVSQQIAPTPSNLQKKGAFLSQGGTTLSSGTTAPLTQLSDLTAILAAPLAVTSIAWATGTATVTTAAAHGVATTKTFLTTITGATPANYNGTYLATSTGASTFTYALVDNGGTTPATGTIKYTPRNQAELLAMGTTFFAQGNTQSVSVLELGAGESAAGVTALSTFIAAQPTQPFYSYLVPRSWDSDSTFKTYLATLESPTAKTYFFVTTTTGTYSAYTNLMKDVWPWIDSPTAAITEFGAAGPFYATLNYNPSTTNKVAPLAWEYLYGITPYPTVGNAALFTALRAANINYAGTGAEGGISNVVLVGGTLADGNDFTWWYSIDWVQINVDLNVSNAVINGSNNPVNPLYYNQDGIDRLQAVAAQTMSNGVTYGLVLGTIVQTAFDGTTLNQQIDASAFTNQTVVNAVPFVPYSRSNPGDFKIGKYAGFSILYTPNRGFTQIIFNLVVSSFVTA
jgi:hypothetical protein